MKKQYYIVKSVSGCMGAIIPTVRIGVTYSQKTKAEQAMGKQPNNKHIIYWIDFEWIN